MKLILVPLMRTNIDRQLLIRQCIDVAKAIPNDYDQIAVIQGILTATDKMIDEHYSKNVREWLRMTKVEKIYQQEKEEALQELQKSLWEEIEDLAKEKQKEKEQALQEQYAKVSREKEQALKEQVSGFAKKLLNDLGLQPEKVSELTGLPMEEVQKINKQ